MKLLEFLDILRLNREDFFLHIRKVRIEQAVRGVMHHLAPGTFLLPLKVSLGIQKCHGKWSSSWAQWFFGALFDPTLILAPWSTPILGKHFFVNKITSVSARIFKFRPKVDFDEMRRIKLKLVGSCDICVFYRPEFVKITLNRAK